MVLYKGFSQTDLPGRVDDRDFVDNGRSHSLLSNKLWYRSFYTTRSPKRMLRRLKHRGNLDNGRSHSLLWVDDNDAGVLLRLLGMPLTSILWPYINRKASWNTRFPRHEPFLDTPQFDLDVLYHHCSNEHISSLRPYYPSPNLPSHTRPSIPPSQSPSPTHTQ